MDSVTRSKLIKILIRDDIFVRRWKEFYDALGLPAANKSHFDNEFKGSTLSAWELFNSILIEWISINGSIATVNTICVILDDLGFQSITQKLAKEIGSQPIISRTDEFKTSVDIRSIADDFVQYPSLKKRWMEFYASLSLDEVRQYQLEILLKNGKLTMVEVFCRLINIWVSQNMASGTLLELVTTLKAGGYDSAAAQLTSKYGRMESDQTRQNENLSNILIKPDLELTKFHNLLPDRTMWYQLGQPDLPLLNVDERSRLLEIFSNQVETGITQIVSIIGARFIGNFELAKTFAYELRKNSHVNCINVNCKNLKFEFEAFMFSCGVNPQSMLNLCEKFRERKWLLILRDLDTHDVSTVEYMKEVVLKPLKRVPPDEGPFIILTSTDHNVNSIFDSFRYLDFHDIKLGFEDNDQLGQYMAVEVTPWVQNRIANYSQAEKDVCKKIYLVFSSISAIFASETSKAYLSLLAVIVQFVNGSMRTDYFLAVWAICLGNTKVKRAEFDRILTRCISFGLMIQREKNVLYVQAEVQTALGEHYLKHRGIYAAFVKYLGFHSNEIGILRWISKGFFSEDWRISKVAANSENHPQIVDLLSKIVNHDELILEFASEIVKMDDCFWSLDALKSAYQRCICIFGAKNKSTLEIEDRLATRIYKSTKKVGN